MPGGHFLEESVSRRMPRVICTMHIVAYRWRCGGREDGVVGPLPGLVWSGVWDRGWSVPAEQLCPLSSLFTRERGTPNSRSILPFSCRGVPPAPVRLWGCKLLSWGSAQSRPGRSGLWKARCTRLSWGFIGTSSPVATVGGARRSFQSRCKAIFVLRPPGSSWGRQTPSSALQGVG
jgi:hypothetical protein